MQLYHDEVLDLLDVINEKLDKVSESILPQKEDMYGVLYQRGISFMQYSERQQVCKLLVLDECKDLPIEQRRFKFICRACDTIDSEPNFKSMQNMNYERVTNPKKLTKVKYQMLRHQNRKSHKRRMVKFCKSLVQLPLDIRIKADIAYTVAKKGWPDERFEDQIYLQDRIICAANEYLSKTHDSRQLLGDYAHGRAEMVKWHTLFESYLVQNLELVLNKPTVDFEEFVVTFISWAIDGWSKFKKKFDIMACKHLDPSKKSKAVIAAIGFEEFSYTKHNLVQTTQDHVNHILKVMNQYDIKPNMLKVDDDCHLVYDVHVQPRESVKVLVNVVSDGPYLKSVTSDGKPAIIGMLNRSIKLSPLFAGWFWDMQHRRELVCKAVCKQHPKTEFFLKVCNQICSALSTPK